MTASPRSNFESKFLTKLSKIDRIEIENFLAHLVREKSFLEVIFDAMIDGIIVLRSGLEVIYVNNMAVELLGISPRRRVIGERITDLCPNDEFCEMVARFALQRQKVTGNEIELTAGANRRIVSMSIIPLEAERGHTEGSVTMILHDVTETRQHEMERRKVERAQAYATLAAGLAHEIKNPLNSLMIHAQLMQKALQSRKLKKAELERVIQSGDVVLEEIQRLSRVVTDFLSAVRPTRPLTESASINSLIEHAIATLKPEAESRGIHLKSFLNREIPLTEFDPNQLLQAVLNLIKNAFDAVDDSRDPNVEIRTELLDDGFAIYVIDNGRGISDEEQQRIFQPYYTTKFSGTGLGLAIVSRIVEEHGGQMDVHSREGEGTAVILKFPLSSRPVKLLQQQEGQ
jgi:PAS domain S-box-containing protein